MSIADADYRRLKAKAAHEGTSVRQIFARLVRQELDGEANKPAKRLKLPILKSTGTDKIVIDNERIYDLIGFP